MLAEGQDNISILAIDSGGFNWGQNCTSNSRVIQALYMSCTTQTSTLAMPSRKKAIF